MSETPSPQDSASAEGLRERKRRETRQRIAETGLRLFLADGFDSTTLDAVAAEAGISRRTFFSYFKSKDDVVLYWQEAGWNAMHADLLKASPDARPLDVVRDVMADHTSRYSPDEMAAIDALMRSSESLLARKQTFYVEQEKVLFNTLCEVWRQPERRPALRMVAMVCIGSLRVAIQSWYDHPGERKPMVEFLRDAFANLRSEL